MGTCVGFRAIATTRPTELVAKDYPGTHTCEQNVQKEPRITQVIRGSIFYNFVNESRCDVERDIAQKQKN